MTAVEWLVGQLKEYNHLSYDEQSWIFEQAKEMEKQQAVEFAYEIADDLAYGVYSKESIECMFNKHLKDTKK